jgi:hypothetical protein
MADLDEEFNPADVPEDDHTFEPIPAGDYQMQVIESDIKPTKAGTGEQLILTLEILDGPMAKRRIWDRLNIRNQNPDAQRIAQRSLADLCLALNISALRNTEELHFKPFVGKVTIKQDKTGQYGPQNVVRYKSRGGQPPERAAAPASRPAAAKPAAAPAKPAGNARPWAART